LWHKAGSGDVGRGRHSGRGRVPAAPTVVLQTGIPLSAAGLTWR